MKKIWGKLILLLFFIISLFIWNHYTIATTYQENIGKEEINTFVDKDEEKEYLNKEIKKTDEEIIQKSDDIVIKKSTEINNTEKEEKEEIEEKIEEIEQNNLIVKSQSNDEIEQEQENVLVETRVIEDGKYIIKSVIDENFVFDIYNNSTTNGANLEIWKSNKGKNQKFVVKYIGNGEYSIFASHSNKSIDVEGNEKTSGTNVLQWVSNNQDNQKWIIKPVGEGIYKIISKSNGLCLDIPYGDVKSGSNVQVWVDNGGKNQMFKFEPVVENETITESKTIKEGKYIIKSAINDNYVFDIYNNSLTDGANLEIWKNNQGENQKFNVKKLESGEYSICASHSNKCIDVEGNSKKSGTNVLQWTLNNQENQKWIIEYVGDEKYKIISKTNGLCLDIPYGDVKSGANVQVWTDNGGENQLFKFEYIGEIDTPISTIVEGIYGKSGLKIKENSKGSSLKYYKYGTGPNVYFATFAMHGWEDDFEHDGQELTKIANAFKDKLMALKDPNIEKNWTIYIFPSVNPDGEYNGWSHNGPGRTTLYSDAPEHKGIDMNRTWSTDWVKYTTDRNYTGTEPFQAYEARYLRDFLLSHKSTNGQTILVDLHGWLNETMGDDGISSYYRSQLGMSKHISSYGRGYLINWARANLGSNGRTARSALIELPEAHSSQDVDNWRLADKYINATITMLRGL